MSPNTMASNSTPSLVSDDGQAMTTPMTSSSSETSLSLKHPHPCPMLLQDQYSTGMTSILDPSVIPTDPLLSSSRRTRDKHVTFVRRLPLSRGLPRAGGSNRKPESEGWSQINSLPASRIIHQSSSFATATTLFTLYPFNTSFTTWSGFVEAGRRQTSETTLLSASPSTCRRT